MSSAPSGGCPVASPRAAGGACPRARGGTRTTAAATSALLLVAPLATMTRLISPFESRDLREGRLGHGLRNVEAPDREAKRARRILGQLVREGDLVPRRVLAEIGVW